jgi:PadR family transcriptional regulator
MAQTLSQLEVLALLALARLGDDAYGVTVREEIATVTGRDVSMAAVYAALDRLERIGLARPWRSEPRPERGGRARRHFAITAVGRTALRTERAIMMRMWQGVTLSDEGRRR